MTTEQQQRSEDQGAAATATDVNAKVASMREAILKAARPAASAAAARPAAAAAAPAKNMAGVFARKMMQSSWIAQTDGQLLTDSVEVLEGGCVYLPGFLCEPHDYGRRGDDQLVAVSVRGTGLGLERLVSSDQQLLLMPSDLITSLQALEVRGPGLVAHLPHHPAAPRGVL